MNNLVCFQDFENFAVKILPKNALDYYKSGAGAEYTLFLNRSEFKKYRIRPRMLRDVSVRNLSLTVFGSKISMPIGIAPTAMQRMAHPEGECANVKAAEAYGTIFILSTLSTSSVEEVAEAAPNCVKWFQLYLFKDREVSKKLIQRAEKSNFKALVLTVDAPVFGLRRADIRNQFSLPSHLSLSNFSGEKATKMSHISEGSSLNNLTNLIDGALKWEDIRWLRSVTDLPIILKGILTAEDAIIGADLGAAGILVSNHGGRQIDGAPASIEALPEIVKAVGNRCEIFFDGGVMDGTDAFKAIALGAKMVFLGKPPLWGLAHSGQKGVEKILEIIRIEFDYALALTGCRSLSDVKPELVTHESSYSNGSRCIKCNNNNNNNNNVY